MPKDSKLGKFDGIDSVLKQSNTASGIPDVATYLDGDDNLVRVGFVRGHGPVSPSPSQYNPIVPPQPQPALVKAGMFMLREQIGDYCITFETKPADSFETIERMRINEKGVSIGTKYSGAKLEVNGDIEAIGYTKLGHIETTGDITVKGGDIFLTGGADCAEDFDIIDAESIEPGTVMVIDSEGALRASEEAYDKRVAGVISGAGDLRPGITLDKQKERANRLPLALTGKVYCKVDAEKPIEVGDLLTTSSTIGHAMKVDDHIQSIGAIIGKALRSLKSGRGMIPILVALQ